MRRAHRAGVALLAAAALTACGGGDDDDQAAPGPAPTVTVTVTETATPADGAPPAERPTPQPTATGADAHDPCDGPELEGAAFIFVTSPRVGAAVSDGDPVEGCSSTFEATYEYELVDGEGTVLDSGFGTATCGTGCVGEFSFELDFTVPQATIGHLEVFTSSARDGSRTLVNSLPVLLRP